MVSPHHLSKHTDKLLLHFPTRYLILPTPLKLRSRTFISISKFQRKLPYIFSTWIFLHIFFLPFLFSFCFLVPTQVGKRRYTNSFRFCFPPGFLARLSVKRLRARNGKHIFVVRSNSVQRRKEVLSPCRWRVCVHAFTDTVSELLWKVERILTVSEEFPFNWSELPSVGTSKVLIKFWMRTMNRKFRVREFLWN